MHHCLPHGEKYEKWDGKKGEMCKKGKRQKIKENLK
jgi:hypothetical protein